jgi:hypothetical protein
MSAHDVARNRSTVFGIMLSRPAGDTCNIDAQGSTSDDAAILFTGE